jgi:hypothetical protein
MVLFPWCQRSPPPGMPHAAIQCKQTQSPHPHAGPRAGTERLEPIGLAPHLWRPAVPPQDLARHQTRRSHLRFMARKRTPDLGTRTWRPVI